MIEYPAIDPVTFSIGGVRLHWYGVCFAIAFAAAWWLGRRRASQPSSTWTPALVDDLVFYSAIGAIVGGRIGWIVFYGGEHFIDDPLMIFRVWEGGMSFHGGFIGVLIATTLLARRRTRRIADVFDFMAPLPGIGILAVRLANFINGELWGRPTNAAWGFIVDPSRLYPRQRDEALNLCSRFDIEPCVLHVHATQLYEGLLEGLVGFLILWFYTSRPRPRLAPSGLFLLCYGLARFLIEFIRIPDENRGYLFLGWVTMGQILSSPMILAGIALLVLAYRRNEASGNYRSPTK